MIDSTLITGAIILVVAMVALTIIVVWSIRTINRIDQKGCRTSRQTLKELNDG